MTNSFWSLLSFNSTLCIDSAISNNRVIYLTPNKNHISTNLMCLITVLFLFLFYNSFHFFAHRISLNVIFCVKCVWIESKHLNYIEIWNKDNNDTVNHNDTQKNTSMTNEPSGIELRFLKRVESKKIIFQEQKC